MPRNPNSEITGSASDPAFRRRLGRYARAQQTTLDYHVRKVLARSSELTADQRQQLATLTASSGEGDPT